jgi:DsbC/DsbD-like thiol-disulfide interchange protein
MARLSWLRNTFLPPLFLAVMAGTARASVANHVEIRLISEYKGIAPGHASWIGLRFELEPGWHIYWKDPGDSGEPPSIRWNLPAGFRAGSIHWPTPERIPDHTLVDYGYGHDVLLIARLWVFRAIHASQPVTVSAAVNYLVCKDVCIPGTAHATISLPVSPGRAAQPSEWRTLFLQTRARWPKSAPAKWKISALATAHQFLLTLHTGSSELSAVFFPTDPSVIKNAAPQPATALPDGVRLNLEKSDLLAKAITHLNGVIVLNHRRAFVINAPIHQQTKRGG